MLIPYQGALITGEIVIGARDATFRAGNATLRAGDAAFRAKKTASGAPDVA